ncbi:MAG: metallophosphoesterase family protein [Acidimicrobiia bacterium]
MTSRRPGRRRSARRLIVLLVAAQLVAVPPAASPAPGDAVLVGAGDIASCSSNDDETTAALIDQVVAEHPDATVFTTGDNVYNSGTADEFARCYEPSWGRHRFRTRPVPGNHDYRTSGAGGYYGYFGSAAGDPGTGYYEYHAGSWQVIVLNSACSAVGGCGAGSPQEQWLRAVLAASSARCTLALWHHPVFSSSSQHGSHSGLRPFWQALYDGGADVVLAGHDHVYERFGPQTATGGADAGFGVRQFTVGTGGKSHYGFGNPLPNSEVRHSGTTGVLRLTLRDQGYDWRFLPEPGGTFTDSGTGACHGLPPPAAPAG